MIGASTISMISSSSMMISFDRVAAYNGAAFVAAPAIVSGRISVTPDGSEERTEKVNRLRPSRLGWAVAALFALSFVAAYVIHLLPGQQ